MSDKDERREADARRFRELHKELGEPLGKRLAEIVGSDGADMALLVAMELVDQLDTLITTFMERSDSSWDEEANR